MTDLQGLLSALDVFSRAPDRDALEKANSWLQDFQHSSEAWNTCGLLLSSPDAPPAAKMFAAQTFRQKITYDLQQVPSNQVFALRDTLLAALAAYKDGPRGIVIQLCLALSGLAIQIPTWGNAVQTMVETFGNDPATVSALLEFLIVLPEELCSNMKIPITDDEYRERIPQLLTNNAKQILGLLAMYLQAPGVTIAVQNQVFRCLRSWLVAGEVTASAVAETPLFNFSFDALASDQLFDAAVDVVCDLIHETQEVDDNMPVIERIMPHVIALRSRLAADKEDADKIRGYARILTEAGECYRSLILHHTEAFFPLVEAILECSAYDDLDIVPITFPFWERLAQSIGKRTSLSPLFQEAYKQLMKIVIGHLHFPPDTGEILGQDRDNFRQFRHVMGDTLKDCCLVLGTEMCLTTVLDMVTVAMSRMPNVTWQDVEAPLFAMRSMGAEIDPNDEKSVPKVMDLIPHLPSHPRVRYAALLLVSRYTRWINQHMDYVPAVLQFISSGFEDADDDVCAAAGHAMRYLCEDCKHHLVPFIAQLHTFITTIGPRLIQDDRVVVYEAIAHVISAMPMEEAAQMLRTFALDLLQSVHQLAIKVAVYTKQDIKTACDNLANLEVMLYTVGAFGEALPEACRGTCEQAWEVLDAFFSKFGTDQDCAEAATRVIRQGLLLFGNTALSIVPSLVSRMSTAFENTGISSYLWVIGKVVQNFGNEEDPTLRAALRAAYEQTTNQVVLLLGAKQPGLIPDVLDDFVRMLIQLVDFAPDILFESSAFPYAFRAAMAALTLVQSDVVFAALDFFRIVLNHDCLHPTGNTPPPKFPIYASAIGQVLEKEGLAFVGLVLTGVTGDFPEDSGAMVISIVRNLAAIWPQQLLQWAPPALQALPNASVPDEAKSRFMNEITSAVSANQPEKVKYAVLGIHRTSRKARERRRVEPMT